MDVDPHISFEGVPESAATRARVEEEIEKLERFFGRITACRVVVCKPQRRRHHGDLYQVFVHLTAPGGRDVHVDRSPSLDHAHEDLNVAIRDAFKAARRKLQDEARKLRGETKHHEGEPEAAVGTLVAEEGYGFLETDDGREIYFHRNSVANGGFDRLRIGERVAYSEAMGDKGPQATYVRPL